MNSKVRNLLLIALAVVAVAGFLAVPMLTIEVDSEAKHRFQLDVKMPRVRKILVRTNAVKKIVAMADATLLDQKWQTMAFDSDGPLLIGDWHVSGEGQLSIQVNDDYLGEQSIQLKQAVDVRPNRVYSTNDLTEPSESIRQYASTLELIPGEDNNAVINLALQIKIRTTASWITRPFVKQEIEAAAAKSLAKQEAAIQELVDQQRGNLLIVPNFGRK